jgi:hypothetical protein
MAHRDFLIRYSNGFKRHVSRQELASMSHLIQLGPREYLSPNLQHSLEETNGPHYLAGQFTIELKGQRETERMETPRGMLRRLEAMGFQPNVLQVQ